MGLFAMFVQLMQHLTTSVHSKLALSHLHHVPTFLSGQNGLNQFVAAKAQVLKLSTVLAQPKLKNKEVEKTWVTRKQTKLTAKVQGGSRKGWCWQEHYLFNCHEHQTISASTPPVAIRSAPKMFLQDQCGGKKIMMQQKR